MKESRKNKSQIHQPYNPEASIFIGGIPQSSVEADIVFHFSKYGRIDSITLPRDPKGRLKGFVLVHFKSKASVQRALKKKEDKLGGKLVSIAPCLNMAEAEKHRNQAENLKIFLKGFKTSILTPEASVKKFFEQFGEIEHFRLILHPKTKRPRGFGYVMCKDKVTYNRITSIQNFKILGTDVIACPSQPRSKLNK